MASYQLLGPILTLVASIDLSTSYRRAVTVDVNGKAALPTAGGPIIGITTDKAVLGQSCPIQWHGVAEWELGGTVAKGDFVKTDVLGRAVLASAADVAAGMSCGRCLEGGAVGNFGAIFLMNFGNGFAAASAALEIVAAAGALSVITRTTLLNVQGTKVYTLAAGLYPSQRKLIQCSVAGATPVGSVTGLFTDTDGTTARTSITLIDAAGDGCELEWTGTSWQVITKTTITMA